MQDLLIIGGVAAGATAAARARRLNNEIHITLLETGADVSFANCGLPYYIGRDIEHRSSLILASEETFNDQYRVKVHTHTEAIEIDRLHKRVKARNTQTGEENQNSFPESYFVFLKKGIAELNHEEALVKKYLHEIYDYYETHTIFGQDIDLFTNELLSKLAMDQQDVLKANEYLKKQDLTDILFLKLINR